jgi:hypothetical protein
VRNYGTIKWQLTLEIQSPLDKLKEQRTKLTARIQAAEARSKTSERKKETQRKIVVGAYYLDQARKKIRWMTLGK